MTAAELAAAIAARIEARGACRCVIDGPDCAGKTTLADAVAARLAGRGVSARRLTADDHLRPAAERHARDAEDPAASYHEDSIDFAAVARAVTATPGPVVADGIFMLGPALRELWDIAVYLTIDAEEMVRRGRVRDVPRLGPTAEAVEARYRRRYVPAHARYRERDDPVARADLVVDNSQPAAPVLVRDCAP